MYLSLASVRVDIEFERDGKLVVRPLDDEIKTPDDFRNHCVDSFVNRFGSKEKTICIKDTELMCTANIHISSVPKIIGRVVSISFRILINQTDSVEHEVKSNNLQVETIEAAVQLVTDSIVRDVNPDARMSADVDWLPLTQCKKYSGIMAFSDYDRLRLKLISNSLETFVWGNMVESVLPGSYAPKWSELSKSREVMSLPTDMYNLLHNMVVCPVEEATHPYTRALRLPIDKSSVYVETLAKILHWKNMLVDPVVYYLNVGNLNGDSADLYDALSLMQGHMVVIDLAPIYFPAPGLPSFESSLIKGNQLRQMIDDNPSILFIIRDGADTTVEPPNISDEYKKNEIGSLDIILKTLLVNLPSLVDIKSYDVSIRDIRRCVKSACAELGRPNYTDKITRNLRKWVKESDCDNMKTYTIYQYTKLYIGYEEKDVPKSIVNFIDRRIMDTISPGYLPSAKNMPENINDQKPPIKPKKSRLAPMDKLDSLVGLYDVKNMVKKLIAHYQFVDTHKKMGASTISNHMIFTGNPGTAKTTTARIMYDILVKAGRLKPNRFVEVGRQDLVGQYVGQTAPKVKDAFDKAIGGMLFIDEAYSLSIKNAGGFGEEAVATIVQEMENHRDDVIVILAGYKEEMERMIHINPGLRSRISFTIDFPDCTGDELTKITFNIIKEMKYTISPDGMEYIRDKFSEGKLPDDLGNGRFARNLAEHAVINYSLRMMQTNPDTDFTILTREDFENAWDEVYKPRKTIRTGF